MGSEEVLSTDELVRLLRIAVTRLGITNIRFTGGEPLLAKDLRRVITATAALSPRPQIALTTNGVALHRQAQALADAGLDRVNVSLDTVDAAHFEAITRRDRLDDVIAGLAAAQRAGLRPVKVNAVLTPRPAATTWWRCCGSAWSTTTSCGSSSRCRWTRGTAGNGAAC